MGFDPSATEVPDARLLSAPEGIVLTHVLVADDVDRAGRFPTDVFGDGAVRSQEPTSLALASGWIIFIDVGGGPTGDETEVTLETRRDRDRVDRFLHVGVGDIHVVYCGWSAPGAGFLTPAIAPETEIRPTASASDPVGVPGTP